MHTNDDIASKLILQGVHVDLTPAMQNIMRDKFGGLLRKNERIIRINVRLNKDQNRGNTNHYTATGQIEIGGPDLVAHVEGDEAYTVIDGLVEKLDKLIRERHDRRKDRRHQNQDIELGADLPNAQSA